MRHKTDIDDIATPIEQELEGVRVAPSLKLSLLVFLGYLAIIVVAGRLVADGAKFSDVAASAANTRNLIVFPVACASIYLTIVTSVLGWWRPAILEPRRRAALPRWMWAIPILAVVMTLADVARSENRGDFTTTHWMWLGIGLALVGYSEELMTRGLLLTGMRSAWVEKRVLIGTTLLFAVMHGLNALGGQDVATTIKQVMGVIPLAIMFYLVRRVTGSLVWSMVVHAMTDFSLIVFAGTTAQMNDFVSDGRRPYGVGVPLLLAVVALIKQRDLLFRGNADLPDDAVADDR